MMIVDLHSPDGKTHAAVQLDGIDTEQYKRLSDFLGEALEREELAYVAVSVAMRQAVERCPNANPADLWVHLIYHQFRNRFNKSDQSWKRVSGQALEHVIASVYQPRLTIHGITLRPSTRADAIAFGLIKRGLGSAKTDLVLEGSHRSELFRFGVIHCKASIAERLTDDVPVSKALMRKGVWSAIATMDAKMFPPPHGDGVVYGELGLNARDKRKYFEVAGQFSGCYSFNLRTPPSPVKTKSGSRIKTLGFTETQPDLFVKDICAAWKEFKTKLR
jgi:BsaWI restriction endonuclease type 2